MIIGIDGNEANVMERVGVSWTTLSLLKEFNQQANPALQFRIFLKTTPLPDLPKANQYWRYVVIPKKTLWSQIDLPLALYFKHRDLNLFLAPAHYSPRFCPCPTVVIVHDLSYFYYPQDFLSKDLYQLINWTGYSVKKAKAVIAVSQLTKQDLMANYSVPEAKISVVYNGFTLAKVKPTLPDFKLKEPYFLALGTLQPRKNLTSLIIAFAKLSLKHSSYLYLVGRKGWLYQEAQKLIKQYRLQDRVILTGYLSEAHKWYLLHKAKALIMPGWYEGFGLPILEAYSAKTPVICSRSGALPEISQEAAVYFSPEQPDELVKAMEQILNNPKVGEQLIQQGQNRLKNFSWNKTAKQILKILAG